MSSTARILIPICLIATSALSGCTSNYTPQARGRVAIMMRDGKPTYVRDGRFYDHGVLGGGLVDAVSGNTAAVHAAHEYNDRMTNGLIGMLGGTACAVGALVYATHELVPDDNGNTNDEHAQRAALVALGCTVVMIIGAGYMATAEPYRWDAINLFNDAPPPPMQLPGQPGYGYTQTQKPALKMRDDVPSERSVDVASDTTAESR